MPTIVARSMMAYPTQGANAARWQAVNKGDFSQTNTSASELTKAGWGGAGSTGTRGTPVNEPPAATQPTQAGDRPSTTELAPPATRRGGPSLASAANGKTLLGA